MRRQKLNRRNNTWKASLPLKFSTAARDCTENESTPIGKPYTLGESGFLRAELGF
jgi:hypothetical protein